MKKSRLIISAAAISLALTAAAALSASDGAAYDSSTDPLVSLSYIEQVVKPEYDKKIAELDAALESAKAENAALKTQLSELSKKLDSLTTKVGELEAAAGEYDGYQVVYLKKSAKLLAESPCEIILRSGSAIAVSITSNGVNDISDGTELYNASAVPLYHCLLVPRGGDGRGIQITSDEAYVMVRGDYQIVQ